MALGVIMMILGFIAFISTSFITLRQEVVNVLEIIGVSGIVLFLYGWVND